MMDGFPSQLWEVPQPALRHCFYDDHRKNPTAEAFFHGKGPCRIRVEDTCRLLRLLVLKNCKAMMLRTPGCRTRGEDGEVVTGDTCSLGPWTRCGNAAQIENQVRFTTSLDIGAISGLDRVENCMERT